MSGTLFDDNKVRATIEWWLEAIEKQVTALARAHVTRLKPGQRRYIRMLLAGLARRILVWQELSSETPELVTRLNALAEQVRVLQIGRRGCSRDRGRCNESGGSHDG